jgi:diacylglycerol O-acyltransferase / wax synthase
MTRLSLFDQLFYKAEKAGLPPLYLAGVMIMEPAKAPHKLTAAIIADHLAARMEKIPLMRQKIVQDPLRIGSVRMVEDPGFDVHNHISISTLPQPGGYKEFTDALGTFSARRLDLSMPPWHYEVIDGLEGGRLALAIHVHHAVMDGLGVQDALSSIYDPKPVKPEKPKKRKWRVSDESAPMSLLSSAMLENAERVFVKAPKYLMKSGLPLAKALASLLTKQLNLKKTAEAGANPLPELNKTSLNAGTFSNKRLVSYVELPLQEAFAIRKRFACSINDLALALNSAALEYYFKKVGEKVDFDLIAVMPMNARKEGEAGPGNVLTIARVNLHNTVPNLAARLRAIAADTARIKAQHRSKSGGASVDGRALMELFSPLVIDSLCFAVAGLDLTSRMTVGNVAITNVPGSPVPLYLAGAPVVSGVPLAPVVGRVTALTITVSSTDRYLLFGYHADGSAVTEKDYFVKGALQAFAKLKRAAAPAAGATSRPKQRGRAPRKRTRMMRKATKNRKATSIR